MWVFGYGSLLWNPGFNYQHYKLARLKGYRRSFCMSSIHHRGTERILDWFLPLINRRVANVMALPFMSLLKTNNKRSNISGKENLFHRPIWKLM